MNRPHMEKSREGPEGETSHLYQRSLDQAGCKSRDVHEWQRPEGESQHANPQDRLPQYFSKNLSHTKIEPALSEDFFPRHLKPYHRPQKLLEFLVISLKDYQNALVEIHLKRGVNKKERVANDVETEKIIFEDVPEGFPMQISYVVQNRGSIPLFWLQETSHLNLKPDIIFTPDLQSEGFPKCPCFE
ncbi:SAC domain-containing protein [Forsythia ovata]|uniref:SAC domain-containing protein n=1 Tax=Forsythia ovata TaxID=205694 RepID=A0ABD1WWP2_9LAMI